MLILLIKSLVSNKAWGPSNTHSFRGVEFGGDRVEKSWDTVTPNSVGGGKGGLGIPRQHVCKKSRNDQLFNVINFVDKYT